MTFDQDGQAAEDAARHTISGEQRDRLRRVALTPVFRGKRARGPRLYAG